MTALSHHNRQVQRLRRLLGRRSSRREEGLAVVEGPTLTAEAVAAGWECLAQYVPEGSAVEIAGAGPVVELAAGVLERVATTESPRPPLTLVRPRLGDPAAALSDAELVLVLHEIADPGNVGTMLRSAEAAGVDLVVLTPGSVDVLNPKVLRASAGAVFHVPTVVASVEEVARAGVELLGATSHEHPGRTVEPYRSASFAGRVAVVVGNEAAGLPADWDDTRGPVRRWVTVPHRGRSESLNVAMAATLLVFEAVRRREVGAETDRTGTP